MRILALETATEACSLALFEGSKLLAAHHEVLGRGHAERLVPLIGALPGKGRADELRVSLGPGSFTGTRIGIAAARALGLAWGARVVGFPTLALVAATARAQLGAVPLTVAMTGGHGELYIQRFGASLEAIAPAASLPLNVAAQAAADEHVAGTMAETLVAARGWGAAFSCAPDARHTADLPLVGFTAAVAPLYGRPPDAKLPGA